MADSDELDDILAQTAWLRRLARRLVADEAERDDVVQQAWLEVLRTRSRPESARPWMFGILRNVVRMRLRGDHRRQRRETAEPLAATAPAQPEELVERVEVERRVAAELLQIDEPYRSTLLMRYYDELEPKEIARRLQIPASTVRWRLKEGLDRLRVRLDREFGGDRRRWGLALIPTAAVTHGRTKGIAASIAAALATRFAVKLLAAALGLALVAWGGARVWRARVGSTELARMSPGTPWRGVIGQRRVGQSAATRGGVSIPLWFGQPAAPVRRIAGRVTLGGAPVAGATVELVSALSDAGVLPVATQRSASDGSFDFGSQPPARHFLAASAPQHSPAVLEVDTRDLTTPADRMELRLGGCESSLFGHVNDASGGPVVGARVCYAPPRAACVVSDENGSYEMCLSPRQTELEIAAKGYGTVDESVAFSGRRTQRDVLLTPEATVIGRVVRAEDGHALAGAQVKLAGVGQNGPRWAAPAATVSDAEGRFALSGLAPGRVRLSAVANGAASNELLELNAEPGRVTGEVQLRLAAASAVSGTVTDGQNPVAGAVVAVGEAGLLRADAVTQSDGSFVLDNVPRATQSLRVLAYDVHEPLSLAVDRDKVGGVHVVVAPMGSIAGRVTRAGQPLAGAKVGNGYDLFTFAGDDGRYVWRGLPPGKYRVFADTPVADSFGMSPDLLLGAGEQRAGVDIDVRWGGSISGTIVESNGAPAAGVLVRFEAQHVADGGEDTTAPDGSFRVATLVGGDDYRPFVKPSRRTYQKIPADGDFPTVHVADGASHVTGVRLIIKRAHLTIAGSVVDDSGQPVADVRVAASRIDGGEPSFATVWSDAPSTVSVADGSFRIDNLDAGLYRLEARGGDGSEATLASVAAGAGGVTLKVEPAGGIDGVLAGFATRPSVRAWRQEIVDAPPHYANGSDDTFALRGLSPGEYIVSALGAGGDAATVTVEPGRIASVTLRNRGVATVKGRLFDWRSGAPVAGGRCAFWLRSTSGLPFWDASNVALSDGEGRFTFEGAPAGSLAVFCKSDNISVLPGMGALTSTDGQVGSVEVPLLERSQQSAGMLGAEVDETTFLVARILLVQPHGPADRAGLRVGDVIATVDGRSVANLMPRAVGALIVDHGSGGEVQLGIVRNGATSNVSLVLGPPIAY